MHSGSNMPANTRNAATRARSSCSFRATPIPNATNGPTVSHGCALRATRDRDGFLEFKRSLVKLAQIFRGPVLVIHCDDERASAGFVIDQPLRNDKGMLVTNLTRVALAPHDRLNQWIQIEADLGKKAAVPRERARRAEANADADSAQPAPQRDEPAASMPAVPALRTRFRVAAAVADARAAATGPTATSHTDGRRAAASYGPAMSGPPASTVSPHAPGAPSGAARHARKLSAAWALTCRLRLRRRRRRGLRGRRRHARVRAGFRLP